MRNSTKLLPVLLITLILLSAAPPTDQTIKWMSFEEAVKKSQIAKKPIFIDVYTNWCGWCKRMDQTTFKDVTIVDYMNENYYAVKLNAEQRDDITFNNKTYKFISYGRRGYHELAAALLQGRLSYPSFVVLLDDFSMGGVHAGFQKPGQLNKILLKYTE
ncbi:MAG: DUF255 domain-containing protein [Bacteroidetes bacterium]|nr:DUF255 domain-containing protein [Bacteroidota bacterium]